MQASKKAVLVPGSLQAGVRAAVCPEHRSRWLSTVKPSSALNAGFFFNSILHVRACCALRGCFCLSVPRPEHAGRVPGAAAGCWHRTRALTRWLQCSESGLPTRLWCWQGAGESKGRVRFDLCQVFCNGFCHLHPDFLCLGYTYIRWWIFLVTSGGSWGQHKAPYHHLRQCAEQLQAPLLSGAWFLSLGSLVESIWPSVLGSLLQGRNASHLVGDMGLRKMLRT